MDDVSRRLGNTGQKRILAIDISREGFEWALAHACLSEGTQDQSPVRVQWDPERNLQLHRLNFRAIQIGLGKEAVERYVQRWICRIEDVTPLAHDIHALVAGGRNEEATALLPAERRYTIPEATASILGMTI